MRGASVYRSLRTPGSESRPPETPRDPIATKEGRRGGGKRKGRGYLVDPPPPKSPSRACLGQAAARGEGPGQARPPTASLTTSHARATARNRDFENNSAGRLEPPCQRKARPRRRPKPALGEKNKNEEPYLTTGTTRAPVPTRLALRRSPRTARAGPHLRSSETRITATKSSPVIAAHWGTRTPVQPARPLNARTLPPPDRDFEQFRGRRL